MGGGGLGSKVWSSNINGWRGGGGLYKYEGRTPINVNTGGRAEVMYCINKHKRWRGGGLGCRVWLTALTLKLFN